MSKKEIYNKIEKNIYNNFSIGINILIEATDKLYHGVQFILGDINDRTRKEYGPSKMNYKDRKIHIDPIVNT